MQVYFRSNHQANARKSGYKERTIQKWLQGKRKKYSSNIHTFMYAFFFRLPGHLQMRLVLQDKERRKVLSTHERMS